MKIEFINNVEMNKYHHSMNGIDSIISTLSEIIKSGNVTTTEIFVYEKLLAIREGLRGN